MLNQCIKHDTQCFIRYSDTEKWIKNGAYQMFLRPTSRCLDIARNAEWSV